jgi:hypothetical protein
MGTPVDCGSPHDEQSLVVFDATHFLSAMEIERQRHRPLSHGLSAPVVRRLDRVCAEILHTLGTRWDETSVALFGDRYEKWPEEDGYLPVECTFAPATDEPFQLPGGSLIGTKDLGVGLVPQPHRSRV